MTISNRSDVDLMPNRYVSGESDLPEETAALIARREAILGASYRLMYRKPVEVVRGEGMYLYGPDGQAYLDFYNNVPSLGHSHPEVAEALAAQARHLNANARYLESSLIDYAERLVGTFPATLDRVIFTCTGSESNDLALRIARHVSGGTGVIVSRYAYHGTSALCASISPNLGSAVALDRDVRVVDLPEPVGVPADEASGFLAAQVEIALADMRRRGVKPAAIIFDTILSSDGVHVDPKGLLGPAVELAKKAGALFIADEVQPGFGRMGDTMWGFERCGVLPDLVSLGKPMGNGYPIGAVVGRQDAVDAFGRTARYSNTYAATTMGVAAASKVLEVLQRDDLAGHAVRVGAELRRGLGALRAVGAPIRGIRGSGLYYGVSLGHDETSPVDSRAYALDLVGKLRERRVLVSLCGANEDTLKIRPPMICDSGHVAEFLDALRSVLDTAPVLASQPEKKPTHA